MFPEDQLLPISALQHLLYCARQCGLIHLEQLWVENRYTAEGRVLHERAHHGPDESRPGVRTTRGLPVRSLTHGLTGQCDVVEFQGSVGVPPASQPRKKGRISPPRPAMQVTPIEYKRGKPKQHRADEVQLCAQALCLEEMLATSIPEGFLFYGKRRRRTPVTFNDELRRLTADTAARLHEMIAGRATPLAAYHPGRCDPCSLLDVCQPKALRFKRGAAAWFERQLAKS